MMPAHCPARPLHRLLVVVPALFGIVTIAAAARVLLGLGVPDHAVFRPLLLFNGAMGVVYVVTALAIRRNPLQGRWLAAAVAALNFGVLGAIVLVRLGGGPVAGESVQAMVVRLLVWVLVVAGLTRLVHQEAPATSLARRHA